MIDDWQEMDSAPKNERVLVCPINCESVVAIQKEYTDSDARSGKPIKAWGWFVCGMYDWQGRMQAVQSPKMWRPLPLPPKHLYERKLAADLLEKQVAELRR